MNLGKETCKVAIGRLARGKSEANRISTTVFFYQRLSLPGNRVLVTLRLDEVASWTAPSLGIQEHTAQSFPFARLRHTPVAMPQAAVILLWLHHRYRNVS
jgi:hypothetical protein